LVGPWEEELHGGKHPSIGGGDRWELKVLVNQVCVETWRGELTMPMSECEKRSLA